MCNLDLLVERPFSLAYIEMYFRGSCVQVILVFRKQP